MKSLFLKKEKEKGMLYPLSHHQIITSDHQKKKMQASNILRRQHHIPSKVTDVTNRSPSQRLPWHLKVNISKMKPSFSLLSTDLFLFFRFFSGLMIPSLCRNFEDLVKKMILQKKTKKTFFVWVKLQFCLFLVNLVIPHHGWHLRTL